MMPVQWDRTKTQMLIKFYEENECLWNCKHKSYPDRLVRENTLAEISNKMSKIIDGITALDVRAKLQSIKSQYRKELRAIDNSKQNNDGERIPRLWCFQLLQFLNPSFSMQQNIGNLDAATSDQQSGYISDGDVVTTHSTILTTSVRWHRKHMISLVNLYRDHECLWNAQHQHYQDKKWRVKAMTAIYNKLRKEMDGITLKDIGRKIQSIKSQYRKALQSSGGDGGKGNIPRLWCFELLHFLTPALKMHRDTPDLDTDMDSQQCEYIINELEEPLPAPGSSAKAVRPTGKQSRHDFQALQSITKTPFQTGRRFEWLGEQIVSTLNEMKNEETIDESIETLQRIIMQFKKQDRYLTLIAQSQKNDVQHEANEVDIDYKDVIIKDDSNN